VPTTGGDESIRPAGCWCPGHGLYREKQMGTALLIGITTMLGCVALGLGVFVLGKPPLSSQVRKAHTFKGS
jgi:hypothetical protein